MKEGREDVGVWLGLIAHPGWRLKTPYPGYRLADVCKSVAHSAKRQQGVFVYLTQHSAMQKGVKPLNPGSLHQ
ncbi:MAG: hypothetical protein E6895_03005 [Klebsiella sp.]|nr:hypothetical protein [Klebsiella sp.]